MSADVLSVERPEGTSDARWEQMKISAHKVLTGHFPWCDDHEGEGSEDGGYCRAEHKTPVGVITVHNGTHTGAPGVVVDLRQDVNLLEMDMATARCLAASIENVLFGVWVANPEGPIE
jgi:hypothetical protein